MDFSEYVAARRPRLVRTAVLLGCPQADARALAALAADEDLRSIR